MSNYNLTNPMHAAMYLAAFTGRDLSDETINEVRLMANEMLVQKPSESEFLAVYEVTKLRLENDHKRHETSPAKHAHNIDELNTAMTTLAEHHSVNFVLPA